MNDKGLVFDIKRDASEDGPGIRTTVFFKGCPLSCIWCQNPEGKKFLPEPDVYGKQIGTWYSTNELMYRLLQDKPFFTSTGGGVTLSGGEPTLQMDFAGRLLQALKREGIHTALETSGFFPYESFKAKMLPWLDLIYFDIKLIDVADSKQYCGQSNKHILENFSRLIKDASIPVIPRIPLIPGITTTEKNLKDIAAFLRKHGVKSCELMPYNPLWIDKLLKLGITPDYKRNNYMTPAEQKACVDCFTH
ncbi:pyruvate formate lyase activating enzyme [Nitrosomonas aestuarii]|uniref:Pyruvate formate lyase activating enzyme n=1 Tax=Nitrosomonas aestuarii TaxID=52441 RepID=A0A1I4A6B0_9PROT|nr:radical SAM protein [Nitrosomonas aestuarii]SFK51329.1 pyruvate formate lyase activating enzyme [Nitrosomonas aestuarii]